jgi:hypothetical protein
MNKIYCIRGSGSYITKEQCIPGCNDVCFKCEHFDKDRAVEVISKEEEEEQKYNFPSSMGGHSDYETDNHVSGKDIGKTERGRLW